MVFRLRWPFWLFILSCYWVAVQVQQSALRDQLFFRKVVIPAKGAKRPATAVPRFGILRVDLNRPVIGFYDLVIPLQQPEYWRTDQGMVQLLLLSRDNLSIPFVLIRNFPRYNKDSSSLHLQMIPKSMNRDVLIMNSAFTSMNNGVQISDFHNFFLIFRCNTRWI